MARATASREARSTPGFANAFGSDDPDGARLAAIDRFLADGEVRRPPEAWTSAAVVSPDQATNPSALSH